MVKEESKEREKTEAGAQYKILVIDPSNFQFSSHLKHIEIDSNDVELVTLNKPIRIYKAGQYTTGKEVTQYRDCIDIAVKLAFGLMKSNTGFKLVDKGGSNIIDHKSIKQHDVVKAISNQTDIDKVIPRGIMTKFALREKQVSDVDKVSLFYKTEGAIHDNINTMIARSDCPEEKCKFVEQSRKEIFSTTHDISLIEVLIQFNQGLTEDLVEIVGAQHVHLQYEWEEIDS